MTQHEITSDFAYCAALREAEDAAWTFEQYALRGRRLAGYIEMATEALRRTLAIQKRMPNPNPHWPRHLHEVIEIINDAKTIPLDKLPAHIAARTQARWDALDQRKATYK